MEDSITGAIIAEPNGRVTKSSGELADQKQQGELVNTAIKLLEASNCLIKGTSDPSFHKLNVTFANYEYIITFDGNHIHVYLRRF